MTLTEVQSRTTKTASFTGSGLDVSGITGDWTIKFQLESLTAAKQARFTFEDTITDYTASLAGPTINFKGETEKSYDRVKSFKKQDFPGLRLGVASAQLRLKLSDMDSGATAIYRSWLEY
jgi:hypothetical protein